MFYIVFFNFIFSFLLMCAVDYIMLTTRSAS